MSVKVGRNESGSAYDVSAEFDDALAVAEETGITGREIIRRAENSVHENK